MPGKKSDRGDDPQPKRDPAVELDLIRRDIGYLAVNVVAICGVSDNAKEIKLLHNYLTKWIIRQGPDMDDWYRTEVVGMNPDEQF